MRSFKGVFGVWVLVMVLWVAKTTGAVDCPTVTTLIATCSGFITYGTPDPYPGSPCCDAMAGLNNLADSEEGRRSLCMCLMGLITTYNPNATAIATLPGFCGVSLGFTIDPNTDCNYILRTARVGSQDRFDTKRF